MVKKQNKITDNLKSEAFVQSPVSNREKRLETIIKFLLLVIFGLILLFGVCAVLFIIIPKPVIVVDRETGEIIGEYQTTSYRTEDELLGGSKRFMNYHLSFNSETVYDDFAAAMNMKTDDLKRKRFKYLKESNLANEIFSAKTKSTLTFKHAEIINRKTGISYIELKGDLVFLAGSTEDKRVPFHFILTVKPIPVSSLNTAGLKIVYFEEKEVKSEEHNNAK